MSSNGDSAGADALERGIRIPVICGPTAAGKSAVAMRLAARRDVLLISADSRQVYRGFDVGTAKPDAAERSAVPHRGVDVVDPTERYSAAAWAALAHAAIAEARASGRIPIVVGGTGFYIRALFAPLFHAPELDDAARRDVQRALDPLETSELRRWAQTLDPARASLGRTQLLRAIEVALLTGHRISDLHVARARPATFSASYLLVDPGPVLGSRIAARAAAMIDAGWIDEVRGLMQTVTGDAPAWRATGYEVMRRHALGELDSAEALERVIIETRQYAKRQRTWFRHQLPPGDVLRVSPDDTTDSMVDAWMTEIEVDMARTGGR
jgi:tRNA dimethylallyltransferase